jgi:hypothetical protein
MGKEKSYLGLLLGQLFAFYLAQGSVASDRLNSVIAVVGNLN